MTIFGLEFDEAELNKALAANAQRTRRFGMFNEQQQQTHTKQAPTNQELTQ